MNRVKPINIGMGLCCASIALVLAGCGSNEDQALTISKRPLVQVMELPSPVTDKNYKFSGVLESENRADLSFRVQGVLAELLAEEGTEVTKGQVIARLDPHDFQVSVLELTAKLDEAKTNHQLAKIELQRVKSAINDRAIASVKLDRAVAAEARAKAGVELVSQSLKKAQDALGYTELTAPYSGVIGKTYVDQHEQVNVGTKILTIHRPELLNAVVDVPESQIWNLNLGSVGQVTWFKGTEAVPAVVAKIASVPDRFKRTYEVTFNLQHSPKQLVAGKAVSVDLALPYASDKPIYCIPAMAVASQETQLYVNRVTAEHVKAVPVESVSQTDDSLCVTGNLAPGEQIVIAGGAFVEEGQAVTILHGASVKS
ncbi:efflux RND transporter periplasmic adaptor subunit [Shewanella sp. MR-4]|uniref:efflux RND transporter periplasmic adaptor subunit n=1 Tax=Shewanella sp. (strain MR-4) TaxID=60480 RepID=UPI001D0D1332|nr:efflux RND transporter periplasmic adaptor subunit [Shewanella sp. MR-4]